jgi:hypothetical protein
VVLAPELSAVAWREVAILLIGAVGTLLAMVALLELGDTLLAVSASELL